MAKRFEVCVSRKSEDGEKTYYKRVGSAWLREKDGEQTIGIELDALPIDGRLVCFEPKEHAQEGDRNAGKYKLPRGGR